MGCNYLSLPLIPTPGAQVLRYSPFCTMTSFSDIRFESLFKAKMSKFSNAFQPTYSLLSEYPNIVQSFHIRSIIECGILCWENPGCKHFTYDDKRTTDNCLLLEWKNILNRYSHKGSCSWVQSVNMYLLESTMALDLCIVAIICTRIRDMAAVTSPPDSMFLLTPVALLLTWINLDLACISDYSHYKVWDEITNPFPNFNGVSVEVWNG